MRGSVSNLGLAMGVLMAATFGTSGSFAASLIATGWTPAAAVTVRVVIASLLLTVPALIQLRSRPLAPKPAMTIVLYGLIAVAGAQLCYFNAVSHLAVGVALLVEYSGILLVISWGWVRHADSPRRLTIAGGVTALAGLLLVLELVGGGPHRIDAVGVLWALGAAVGLATFFVLSAEADANVPPLVMAWGGLAVGAVVLGVAGLAGVVPIYANQADVTLLGRQLSWLVPVFGLAVVAAAIPYVAGILAVRLLGATLSSFVGLAEVLAAIFFAWLLLGQRLDPIQLAGGVLVVAGIALVRLDELRRSAPALLEVPAASL